jgi:uncharacterized protein with HEPN domain
MKKGPEVYLDDIFDSIVLIERYLQDVTEERFYEDTLVQDGVVRRFLIISEAVKNLPSEIKERYPDVKWKEIAGFRDVLMHAYGEVNYRRVWKVITDHMPRLKESIMEIRKSQGSEVRAAPDLRNNNKKTNTKKNH